MAVTIKGNTKAEIAKKIAEKFKGVITIKAARKMVKNMGEKKETDVSVPTWFRFRDKNGHFKKMPK